MWENNEAHVWNLNLWPTHKQKQAQTTKLVFTGATMKKLHLKFDSVITVTRVNLQSVVLIAY